MPLTNRFGDVEITDAQTLRALAHPTRLAILDRLQRHGPATATQLSPHVGATPSVVSWHLRHLAGFGLVTDWDGVSSRRERGWQAAARGYRYTLPDDAQGQIAARQLQGRLFASAAGAPEQWLVREEPRLPLRWRRLGGLADTRVTLTAAELRRVEDGMEKLLAPFVRRDDQDAPAGARAVRFLRYVLPEVDEDTKSTP